MRKTAMQLLGILAVLTASLSGHAAEGRIPIYAAGGTMNASGKYILTQNIVATTGPALYVSSGNVDLDLNGFTVTSPAGPQPAIRVDGLLGAESVRIHNGVIIGGSACIDASQNRQLIVEDVDCRGAFGPFAAIHTGSVDSVIIRRVTIRESTAQWGISLDANSANNKNQVIEDNVIFTPNGGGGGIQVQLTTGANIRRNQITLNTAGVGSGILLYCDGCVVEDNTIVGAPQDGIAITHGFGNKIVHNAVDYASGNGIALTTAGGTLVADNVISWSGKDGIRADSGPSNIERNTLTYNGSCGMRINGMNNFFGRNLAVGNFGANCTPCSAGGLTPDSCINAPGNPSHGDNFMAGAL